MKCNMIETRNTKITCEIEVLIRKIYLNVACDHKSRAGAIGAAGMAMTAPVFVREKWWLLEFVITIPSTSS